MIYNIRPDRLRKKSTRLELTPLIDVIFILLIFFAVSTSLIVSHKGIKLHLPAAASVTEQKKGVVVSIDRNQQIYLDQEKIPADMIKQKVNDLLTNDMDLQVVLNADKTTPYNLVIRVLDDIRLGGCYDIVLEAEKNSQTQN